MVESALNDIDRHTTVLLTGFNRGIQSSNLGEQCSAIAQVPIMIKRHPFPMLINSVMLKISVVFLEGNNFLRLCILRACSECKEHLEKLTFSEDIVRNIVPVISSNDPAARALTLRFFGLLSRLTQEQYAVHHAILMQLSSSSEVELDAAIWASNELATNSQAFASSLCPLLCRRLQNISIDPDTKLKLIALGCHMHHSYDMVIQMRQCLLNLLNMYNTTRFVVLIHKVLTMLELHSALHGIEQIDLLLLTLSKKSNRKIIRLNLFMNLLDLARHVTHHWNEHHIQRLCHFYFSETRDIDSKEAILKIFLSLCNSQKGTELLISSLEIYTYNFEHDITERDYIENPNLESVIHHTILYQTERSVRLLSQGLMLACCIALFKNDKLNISPAEINLYSSAYVSNLLTIGLAASKYQINDGQNKKFSTKLHSIGRPDITEQCGHNDKENKRWLLLSPSAGGLTFCELRAFYDMFDKFLINFPEYAKVVYKVGLFKDVRLFGNKQDYLLSRFLCSFLCGRFGFQLDTEKNLENRALIDNILSSANLAPSIPNVHVKDCRLITSTCALLFQLANGRPLGQSKQIKLLHCIASHRNSADMISRIAGNNEGNLSSNEAKICPWLAYRVARKANMHGQHTLAAYIYIKLADMVLSQIYVRWLSGLAEFSLAEARLHHCLSRLSDSEKQNISVCINMNSNEESSKLDLQNMRAICNWAPILVSALEEASIAALSARNTIESVSCQTSHWFPTNFIDFRATYLAQLSSLTVKLLQCVRVTLVIEEKLDRRLDSMHVKNSDHSQRNKIIRQYFHVLGELPQWQELKTKIHTLYAQSIDGDACTLLHLDSSLRLINIFTAFLETLNECYVPIYSEFSLNLFFSLLLEKLASIKTDNNYCKNYANVDNVKVPKNSLSLVDYVLGYVYDFCEFYLENNNSEKSAFPIINCLLFVIRTIASYPLSFPSFLFHRHQTTSLQLVMSPKGISSLNTNLLYNRSSAASGISVPSCLLPESLLQSTNNSYCSSLNSSAFEIIRIPCNIGYVVRVIGLVQQSSSKNSFCTLTSEKRQIATTSIGSALLDAQFLTTTDSSAESGIHTSGPRYALQRKIASVRLEVTVYPEKYFNQKSVSYIHSYFERLVDNEENLDQKLIDLTSKHIKTVSVTNDFFHAEFCLNFPSGRAIQNAGSGGDLFYIRAEAFPVDTYGRVWRLPNACRATDLSVVRVDIPLGGYSSIPTVPSTNSAPLTTKPSKIDTNVSTEQPESSLQSVKSIGISSRNNEVISKSQTSQIPVSRQCKKDVDQSLHTYSDTGTKQRKVHRVPAATHHLQQQQAIAQNSKLNMNQREARRSLVDHMSLTAVGSGTRAPDQISCVSASSVEKTAVKPRKSC